MRKTLIRCSESFKLQAIREIESGRFACVEQVREHYGIKGMMTIAAWLRKFGKNELMPKLVPLQSPNKPDEMKRLQQRVRKLEAALADRYLDTASFAADSATMVSLEAVWSKRPVMLLAEHVQGWVDAPESGDPRFTGSYVTASWVVTGESRPYVRSLGYAGGITPKGRLGAIELVARYGYVDLVDGMIDGGELLHWYLGANWWLSAQWKTGLAYGDADLDRDSLSGTTKSLLCRVQWLY